MDLEKYYDYVVSRDIFGFLMPGSITLSGIIIITQAIGFERWGKWLPIDRSDKWILGIAFLTFAFLLGHVLDLLYRNLFQTRDWYWRSNVIKDMVGLVKKPEGMKEIERNTKPIRKAISEFLKLDRGVQLEKYWTSPEKIHEDTSLIMNWVEKESPDLFNKQVARPDVQSHFLSASGIAFIFFGACVMLAYVARMLDNAENYDLFSISMTTIASILFGYLLMRQGRHKRDVLYEHAIRFFYVLWNDYDEDCEE